MSIPPIPNADSAIDLAEVRKRADERDRLAEAARAAAVAEQNALRASLWDSAMQRAFKGILTRPERHAALDRAVRRESDDE